MTGIIFCHQTGGPITGWAYKQEDLWYMIFVWRGGGKGRVGAGAGCLIWPGV